MTRSVLLSSQARKYSDQLDPITARRVREGLLKFAEIGRGDLKRLKGVSKGSDLFRLRIGDSRVVFELTGKEIRITRIVPRSVGYDWL